MTRVAIALVLLLPLPALADAPAPPFVPAPPTIPNYSATVLPCTAEPLDADDKSGPKRLECKPGTLDESLSLRQLSILRNTIYARYGWDGYRKPWLRDYFHAQPWFHANPKFGYKLLSDADRKNAHFIGLREQSFNERALSRKRDDIYARYGRIWNDRPKWTLPGGKVVARCVRPEHALEEASDLDDEQPESVSNDCYYAEQKWYKPNQAYSPAQVSADDKIELGLLARAMGDFALDGGTRGTQEQSLDNVLKLDDVRQLSLRDLRLLRNTIYARRGRTFKSDVLREHFGGMKWYTPRNDYSDALLTANDKRNIAVIRSVENELGGPLSDEDWLTEPATDGA